MTEQMNPIVAFKRDLKAALPSFGLRTEREQQRMSSVLMVAVERDPELVFADRQSLIASVRKCANHGLVPDGNEATLQVYNTKVKINGQEQWVKKVQYQPMVRGLINRVLRSGKVLSLHAEIVYKGEPFTIDTSGGERRPVHSVENYFDRGTDADIIGFYSVAKLANGTVDCELMGLDDIKKVRAVAKTQKVWDGWFGEKGKVAVIRRHSKRLPLSAEDMDFILNRAEHDLDQTPRDVTPERPKTKAQQMIEDARAAADAKAKPLDGEIMDQSPEIEPEDISQDTGPEDGGEGSTPDHAGNGEDAAEPNTPQGGSAASGLKKLPAFGDGQEAARAGFLTVDQCPHDDGTDDDKAWRLGFVDVVGREG